MGDRCTGLCCRYFSLGPPEMIASVLERDLAKGGKEAAEAQKVKDLLIYRGYFTNPHNEDKEPGHWYTCQHFVVDDDYVGSCSIYETRPWMCQHYPNGLACAYAKTGCTWDYAKRPQRSLVDVPLYKLLQKKRERQARADGRALLQVSPTVHVPNEVLQSAGLPPNNEPNWDPFDIEPLVLGEEGKEE